MPVDVQHPPFAWREQGEGAVVLLLHGLGGSRISWEPQMGALGDRRTIAWDMPGYGEATPLPDGPLTWPEVADAAAALLDIIGVERAHVVGISMGGMIAQHLAARHPRRVWSLTLLSSSPAFGLDGTSPAEWTARRLAPLDEGLHPADYAERVVTALAAPGAGPEVVARQSAAMARIEPAALRRTIALVATHDARGIHHLITAPTLVLVGEQDRETPVDYSQALADRIAGATVRVVPGAGHLLNAEAPGPVN
ncbi:MAG: alpha/beta fold hydrolase, partial [Actinomycetota bacterium]